MDNWIRDARKLAKLTQVQLAERYQIPRSTLQEWEANKYEPPVYVKNLLLRCIAADFNVRIEEPEPSVKEIILTYMDGTPLSLHDEMYVNVERKANRIEERTRVIKGTQTLKCKNGLEFKSTRNY